MPFEMRIKFGHFNLNCVSIILHNQSRIGNNHINWTMRVFACYRFNHKRHPFLHQMLNIANILSIQNNLVMITIWMNFQDMRFVYKFDGLQRK